MSYETSKRNIEKAGGHLIQIYLLWNALQREIEITKRSHNTSDCLIEMVTKAGFTLFNLQFL